VDPTLKNNILVLDEPWNNILRRTIEQYALALVEWECLYKFLLMKLRILVAVTDVFLM